MTKWIVVKGYPIRVKVRGLGLDGLPLTVAAFERLDETQLAELSEEDIRNHGDEYLRTRLNNR